MSISSYAEIPDWVPLLQKSISENYTNQKNYHPIAQAVFVNVNSMPVLQPIAFQSLLDIEPRLVTFSSSVLNADLMGVLKSNASCQVIFKMPITDELIYIAGKMVCVPSSRYMYRFGAPPRKATFALYAASNPALADALTEHTAFWEEERMRQFHKITDRYRATFTWPGPSEPLESESSASNAFSPSLTPPRSPGSTRQVQRIRSFSGVEFGYKYTALSAPKELESSDCSRLQSAAFSQKQSDMDCAKTVAQDNFALLVLRPHSVDYTIPNRNRACGGASRTIWELDSKTGKWLKQSVNPFHTEF